MGRLVAAILWIGCTHTSAAAPEPTVASGPALVIRVAPHGRATLPGAATLPDSRTPWSLDVARRLARRALAAMRAGQQPWQPVRILLEDGIYALERPLSFDALDAGDREHRVSYEAVNRGRVVISGARMARPADATAAAPVPGALRFALPPSLAASMAAEGGQLYLNGRRAVLAREPREGEHWFVQGATALPDEADTRRGTQVFTPEPAAADWLARLDAADRQRAIVHVMQSWTSSLHHLSVQSVPPGTVRVTPAARWAFLSFGSAQRFHVENVLAALNEPGEWIASDDAILYLPLPGERKDTLVAQVPVLDRLLVINGDGPSAPLATNLLFKGITFAHARNGLPAAGYADDQAASGIGAAVEVNRARQIVFDDCRFEHTGGYALWFKDGVRDSVVTRSLFDDLGAGAVRIGLARQPSPDAADASGAITVEDNLIANTGKVFPGAVGIWLGQTFDNTVARNTIHDTTYSAISVGWRWGYGGSTAGRNTIRANLVYNIGQRMLADLGGIYTLGESPGTVIQDNVIREVRGYRGYGAGAWGIYNDEGSSDMLVQSNFVFGTDSGGYHLHYGRNNRLTGNFFGGGDAAELLVTRSDPGRTQLLVADNIFASDNHTPFSRNTTGADVTFRDNLVLARDARTLPEVSTCASACQVSTRASLTVGGSARAASMTGLRVDAARHWENVVANAGSRFHTETPPVAVGRAYADEARRPATTSLSIATTPPGGLPMEFRLEPATSFKVAERSGAPAGKCLLMQDAPGLAYRWLPYAWVGLAHLQGLSRVEFSLLLDASSDITHEWRDDGTPYRVGPSLKIDASGVHVRSRRLTSVEPGVWTSFTVQAGLGTGRWSLTVRKGQASPEVFDDLEVGDSAWRTLRWIGLTSNADISTAACIGRFQASNDPAWVPGARAVNR